MSHVNTRKRIGIISETGKKGFIFNDCLKTVFCNDVKYMHIVTKPFLHNSSILTIKLIFPALVSSILQYTVILSHPTDSDF